MSKLDICWFKGMAFLILGQVSDSDISSTICAIFGIAYCVASIIFGIGELINHD